LATRLGSPLLEAMAATATTVVQSEAGDATAALATAHLAVEGWRRLGVPYELARATARRGFAHRAAGDEDSAATDLDDARRAFVRLGAVPAVAWLDDCSRRRSAPVPGDLTDREVEVLALVATGRTNRDVATELCISEHTVARHLQNIFTKLDVASRTAATRVALEHHLV
jgi:DNA-binding NarL/FixJ family response regulator